MSRYSVVSTIFLVLFIGSLIVDGPLNIPTVWYIGLIIVYAMLNAFGSFVLSWQYFVSVKSAGDPARQAIAITFDDGPIAGKTEKILDILKTQNVKGAFFCIGHRAEQHPDLLKRIDDEGHLIGNHSYSHTVSFDLKSSTMVTKELADTNTVVQKITGRKLKFFRPPYGVTNPMIAKAVRRRNFTVIGWSIRSFDTVINDPEKLLKRVSRSLKGGDIVLFHDYSETMLKILPAFLQHVNTLGLKVVTVDELLKEKAYE